MKLVTILLATLVSFTAYAKAYKCTIDGKTIYQQNPCLDEGTEFEFKADISHEQQAAAKAAHESYLADRAEQAQALQEYIDKERMIRAEELKAIGELKNARQTAREANALEQRNRIELMKAIAGRR